VLSAHAGWFNDHSGLYTNIEILITDDQSVCDLSVPFSTENTSTHQLANLQQFGHTTNAGPFPSLGPDIGDNRFPAPAPLSPPIITPLHSGYPPVHSLQPLSAAYAPSQLQNWQHSLAESSNVPCQPAFLGLDAWELRDSNPTFSEPNRGPADSRPSLNYTPSQAANQFHGPYYVSNSLQSLHGDDSHELLATSNFASPSFTPSGPQQADEAFGQALESSQGEPLPNAPARSKHEVTPPSLHTELDTMSSRRRITRSSAALSSSPPPPEAGRITQPRIKRRRISSSPPVPSQSLRVVIDDSDDLFGSDDDELTRRARDLTKKEEAAETKPQLEIINLEDTDEVPEALRRQEASGRTPLGALQCVICMDDAKNLTVTHCGRWFYVVKQRRPSWEMEVLTKL
jgi:hypothetical protein